MLRNLLRGCTTGRAQRVGAMTMIPLFLQPELHNPNFVAPIGSWFRFGTLGYGTLELVNAGPRETIVPAHTAFLTKQAAQDHASMQTDVLPPGAKHVQRTAVCVQQSQHGYIAPQASETFRVLPWSARYDALHMRNRTDFSRMWNVLHRRGFASMLADYFDSHQKEMDEYVAEFELEQDQIGAVILLGSEVIGIERAPNVAYWSSVWRTLLRDCYGSVATRPDLLAELCVTARGVAIPPAATLALRVSLANQDEERQERAIVATLLDSPGWILEDRELAGSTVVKTVRSPDMAGQVVMVGPDEQVVYLSIVRKPDRFTQSTAWQKAHRFDL